MTAIRVWIVDDRPQDRFLAKRALDAEFEQLVVTEILDAAGFDEALKKADVDVVITDYQIRWTDGLQVLSRGASSTSKRRSSCSRIQAAKRSPRLVCARVLPTTSSRHRRITGVSRTL